MMNAQLFQQRSLEMRLKNLSGKKRLALLETLMPIQAKEDTDATPVTQQGIHQAPSDDPLRFREPLQFPRPTTFTATGPVPQPYRSLAEDNPTWTRASAITYAARDCRNCGGTGFARSKGPCTCTLRGVFRTCLNKYINIDRFGRVDSPVSLSRAQNGHSKGDTRMTYSRKAEEFRADFYLVSKRVLDAVQWQLFKLHVLGQQGWKKCCEVLKMDRGNFFHAVYRIQQRLGRAFWELQPYNMAPHNYFTTVILNERRDVTQPLQMPAKPRKLVVPLAIPMPMPGMPEAMPQAA